MTKIVNENNEHNKMIAKLLLESCPGSNGMCFNKSKMENPATRQLVIQVIGSRY